MPGTSYTLFGEEYTESQGLMMTRVFQELLSRHPDRLPEALRRFSCLSTVDYGNNAEALRTAPAAFLNKRSISLNGQNVWIGTSCNMVQKKTLISQLFQLCGEDERQFVLLDKPSGSKKQTPAPTGKSGSLQEPRSYRLFGKTYRSTQAEMMYHVFQEILTQKPELVDWAAEHLKCVAEISADGSVSRGNGSSSYFGSRKVIAVGERFLLIGSTCNLKAKQRLIDRLLQKAGFQREVFQIIGDIPLPPLRDWQREAVQAVMGRLSSPLDDRRAGMLSMPVGTGKSRIIAELIRLLGGHGWSVLVLTSTAALADGYVQQLVELLGGGVELVRSRQELKEKTQIPGTAVVSTAQKLLNERGSSDPDVLRPHAEPYSTLSHLLVLVEEAAYHYFNRTYHDMLDRFPNASFLGITASLSPRLFEHFGPVLYMYTYKQACQDGVFRSVVYQEFHWESLPEFPAHQEAPFKNELSFPCVKAIAEWIAEQSSGEGRQRSLLVCSSVAEAAAFCECLFPRLGPDRLRVHFASSQTVLPFPEAERWDGRPFQGLVIICAAYPTGQSFDTVYLSKKVKQFELLQCLSLLLRKEERQSGPGLLVDFQNSWEKIRGLLPEGLPLSQSSPTRTSALFYRDRLDSALAGGQYLKADILLREMGRDLPEEGARLREQLAFLFPPELSPPQREQYWHQHRTLLSWQCGLWRMLSRDSSCLWEPPAPPEENSPPTPVEDEEETPRPVSAAGSSYDRGLQLELAARELIQGLFALSGSYDILGQIRRQASGTQFGFDVIFTYQDHAGISTTCAVECKNYQSTIGDEAIIAKLSELQSTGREIDHWILISPHGRVSNQMSNLRECWLRSGLWDPIRNIQFWTADERVDELFGLFPTLYAQFYQTAPDSGPADWSPEKRQAVFRWWRSRLTPVPRLPEAWKKYLRTPDLLLTQEEADPTTAADYQFLYQCRTPIHLLDEQEQPIDGPAEDCILRWLQQRDRPCALLLGDFGDGKTFFTYVLARRLAEDFLRSPKAGWIPLRLSLRELGDHPQRFRDFLEQRLREFGGDVASWNEIKREYRFLIMLDGLDEMSLGMSDAAVLDNLTVLEDLMEQFRGCRLLVTSRKMAIYSDRIRERILLSLDGPDILHMGPVAPGDRVAFLERLADTPERKAQLQRMRSTYDLLALAAKPLFLNMMRVQLDSGEICPTDAAGIYQSYAEAVLRRKYNYQLAFSGDHTNPAEVRDHMFYLLEELALCLQLSGRDSIGLEDFRAHLSTPNLAHLLWDSMDGGDAAQDADNRMTNRSLLKYDRCHPENRSFCHRSMKEHFLARAIVRRLSSDEGAAWTLLSACGFSYEVLNFAGDGLRALRGPERRLAGQRLTEFARQSRGNWNSPLREALARLGTNSVNLLHIGGFGLPGADWSGLLLDCVLLSEANLSGKNFSHCSMRYAHLDNADLTGCDLRGCDFTGVQFERSGQLRSFAADPGEGALLACYRDGKVRRWQTSDGGHRTVAQTAPGQPVRLLLAPGGREGIAGPERFTFWRRQDHEPRESGSIALRPGLRLLDIMGDSALVLLDGRLCLLDTAEGTLLWQWECSGGIRACLMGARIVVHWSEETGLTLTDLMGGAPHGCSLPLRGKAAALDALALAQDRGTIAVGFEDGGLQLLRAWVEQEWRLASLTPLLPGSGERVLETALDSGGWLYAAGSSGTITRYRTGEDQELEEDRSYRLDLNCRGALVDGVRPQKQYELLRAAAGQPG